MSETAAIQQSLLETFYQLSLPQQQELLNFADFLRQKTSTDFYLNVNHQLPEKQSDEWKILIQETQDMPTSENGRVGSFNFS